VLFSTSPELVILSPFWGSFYAELRRRAQRIVMLLLFKCPRKLRKIETPPFAKINEKGIYTIHNN
jgi:hypothetical protein